MILTKRDYNVEMLKGGNFIKTGHSVILTKRDYNVEMFRGGNFILWIEKDYWFFKIFFQESNQLKSMYYIMTNWDKTTFMIESRGKRFKYLSYTTNTSCI
jgi:hypothetical protein